MINYIKRDFISVSQQIEGLVKRPIPFGIRVVYYVLGLPLGILLLAGLPFIKLYFKWKINRIIKQSGEA